MDRLKPLTWGESCAMGRCAACPLWRLEVPEERGGEVVTVALWGKQHCPIKGKEVKYDKHVSKTLLPDSWTVAKNHDSGEADSEFQL